MSLVEQPTRDDPRMIALQKVECLIEIFVLDRADLHDNRYTGIIEDLWSKLGMPESLSFVPGE